MWNLLQNINKNMTIAVPVLMVSGFAAGIFMDAAPLKQLIVPFTFLMVYPMIQVQSAAWYVKFADAFFGKATMPTSDLESGILPSVKPILAVVHSGEEKMVPAFRKILYATDLSATARHAVGYACSMGDQYGAEVNVLHVVPDIVDAYASETGIPLNAGHTKTNREELYQEAIDDALRKIRQHIRETSRKVLKEIPKCPLEAENIFVQVGEPAERTIETAGK